jgi:hypothetical protein
MCLCDCNHYVKTEVDATPDTLGVCVKYMSYGGFLMSQWHNNNKGTIVINVSSSSPFKVISACFAKICVSTVLP